jgi:aldose 1-epimerase
MTYGATLVAVETPDRNGKFENVTLHLDSLAEYLAGHPCFGSICGRYANRIAQGKFTLEGVQYALVTNGGPHHIHGGRLGFDKVAWQAEAVEGQGFVGVKLAYTAADGEEGYPGKLAVTVTYVLTEDDQLKFEYAATTDRPTILNLTNHAYWNLAGKGNVLDHELTLNADRYLPADATLLPRGEILPVKGTPMDFTRPQTIGSRIENVPGGYDHCYVLNQAKPGELAFCARVVEPKSGRAMAVHTTEPGVQLYTANFLQMKRAGGKTYGKHDGFCLETQHFPDSPNRPHFPSTVLRPGETYRQTTVHQFSVKE